jgi:ketosteroid isomerase-like protein
MGAQENAEVIRRGYDAFNAGDIATLNTLFDDGVRWHSPGRGPMANDYEGREATFTYFGRLGTESAGTFQAKLQHIVASDDLVIGIHHDHATRGDKTLDTNVSLVFRLKDNKIVEAWEYYDDLYVWDDFWS